MCYCGVTDPSSLVVLSSGSLQRSKATEETKKSIKRCLECLMTFPNGDIACTESIMVLWLNSDPVSLVEYGTFSSISS